MKSDLSRKAEDYLEAVYVISQEKGHVRIRDICKELGTKPPSVVEMVKKLNDRGYLVYKKNEGVYLTAEGEEIGRIIKDRHDTIFAFLKFIGVPEQVADEDACVIEHELHTKTVEQIKSLVSFIETAPDHPQWLDHFAIFCELGKHSCIKDARLSQTMAAQMGAEMRRKADHCGSND
ncbi:metal-dependent transcriptional regulator [Methanosaeta sp. UBA458]|jgi:DtxR family Mn-dependent transcriptional regulator|uniref:metal-dependent transcriptional regulator n=1 Tax=Methanosaeta sp. UBA458 TaxID=1915561 RepID=UPI002579A144|nr:metal-dependent transcriptional regulator [Methanosaeta sp. UBA458]